MSFESKWNTRIFVYLPSVSFWGNTPALQLGICLFVSVPICRQFVLKLCFFHFRKIAAFSSRPKEVPFYLLLLVPHARVFASPFWLLNLPLLLPLGLFGCAWPKPGIYERGRGHTIQSRNWLAESLPRNFSPPLSPSLPPLFLSLSLSSLLVQDPVVSWDHSTGLIRRCQLHSRKSWRSVLFSQIFFGPSVPISYEFRGTGVSSGKIRRESVQTFSKILNLFPRLCSRNLLGDPD